ncbi:MAG: TIM barrel protein [Phycisphaerales bacterium]
MKIAYSTTVCPGWTLDEAISVASDFGFLGLEMRSFTDPEPGVMCDPYQMDADAVESKLDRAGLTGVCISTGVRLDKPIFPPVIGRVFVNEEAGVSETKSFVEFAANAGVKYVRVFGFEIPTYEPRAWGLRRVGERLMLAAQTARNTDTRLLIENGGSFAKATDLLELLNMFPNQWLGVSYNIKAAMDAGECPIEGVQLLKKHLHTVKMIDVDDEHQLVALGEGEVPCHGVINQLVEMGFGGWVVYEYPKLWITEDGEDPRTLLKHASTTLYSWMRDAESNLDSDSSGPSECEAGCACQPAGASA